KPVPLRLHFEPQADNTKATITIPTERIMNSGLSNIKSGSNKLHFELETSSGPMNFDGTLNENSIQGTIKQKELQGSFEAIHLYSIDPKQYFGIYEFSSKEHLYIRTWDELGENQLTFLDDAGGVGPLYPSTETNFYAGSGLWIALPTKAQVIFRKDKQGNIEGLTWSETGKEPRFAIRVSSYKDEEVTFKNGDIQLSGWLVIPSSKGPHPAVVLVHGSGPVTRDFYGPLSYILAHNGIAVLSYDKRGIGKSTGHWLDQSFEDLASDVLAAFNFLKTRKEIQPEKIGLFGISQGGWIVPLAAGQSKDVAFTILISAAGVTPAEQTLMSTEAEMRAKNLPEEQIKPVVMETKAQIDSLNSEESRKEFEAQVEKLKSEGNQTLLNSSGLENPRFLLFYRRIMNFQTIPNLQKLNCPVLVIYGDKDRVVPVQGNREKLEKGLEKNRDTTFMVFPDGDHALLLTKTGSSQDFFYSNQFVPGFFQLMIDWIQQKTRSTQIP
ncbi:MAG TPA: alpha/beta fold hydrolase, partial [Acidobacteriota bacterium]